MIILNMLTPVTTVSLFQLVVGNCLLGILESYLIQYIFKKTPNYFLIIVGNYISAITGFLVACVLLDHTQLNLIKAYEAREFSTAIAAYTGMAYLLTLFLEFPFFFFGIRDESKKRLSLKHIMEIVLIVHLVSYFFTLISWIILVGS